MIIQLLFFILSITMPTISHPQTPDAPASLYISHSGKNQDQINTILNSISSQNQTKSILARLHEYAVTQDIRYRQKFGASMGYNAVENIMSKNNYDFLKEVLQRDHYYEDQTIRALVIEYDQRGNIKKKHKQKFMYQVAQELACRQQQKDDNSKNQQIKLVQQLSQRLCDQEAENTDQKVVWQSPRFLSQQEIVQDRMNQLGVDLDQANYLLLDDEMIKQEYATLKNICDIHTFEHDPELWLKRTWALQQTIDQNYQQSWQEFDVSVQAKGYLQAIGLHSAMYETCYGTTLQHEINRQNCCLIEQIAQQQLQHKNQSIFFKHAIDCIDASWWSNEFEAVTLAMGLQDLGNNCCQIGDWVIKNAPLYAQAVAEGIVLGAQDTAHMLLHPIDTISGMAQSLIFVMETISLIFPDPEDLQMPEMQKYCQDRFKQIEQMCIQLKDWYNNSTGPYCVREATRFISGCKFQHKALQAIGAVAGVAKAQIPPSIKSQPMLSGLLGEQELIYAEVGEKITQATEELDTIMQKNIADMVTTSKQPPMLPKSSKLFDLPTCIEKMQKFGGKIPARNTELYNNMLYWIEDFNKKSAIIIDPVLLEQCAKMTPILEKEGFSYCMDLEHIVNAQCAFIEDASKAFYTFQFKGGHAAGTIAKLETTGFVKIESCIEFGNGCIEYQVKDLFSGKISPHTEFPSNWNATKIAQETTALYESAIRQGLIDFNKDKPIVATIKDGFDLKIMLQNAPKNHACIVNEGTINQHIVTSHPIYKGKR